MKGGGIMGYRVLSSRMRSLMTAFLVSGLLMMHGATALALEEDGSVKVPQNATPPFVDLVVTRPLGIVATGIGIALFVPTAILTGIVAPRDINVPFELLVWAPIKYTFVDRLGAH